jgi:hypothetical protein
VRGVLFVAGGGPIPVVDRMRSGICAVLLAGCVARIARVICQQVRTQRKKIGNTGLWSRGMNGKAFAAAGACALILLFVSGAVAQTVQDIVDQVNQATYTHYLDNVLYTHDGDNRGPSGADHDPARSNIFDHFVALGLDTSLYGFQYNSSTYYNVVAVQTGATRPDDIYIVGAHYDSVGNPGADDNASGTAGVLEAARVLSQYSFEATLIYIGFDLEESGLVGSNAYATDHSGDNILGMISLDMIAYNYLGQDAADIYGYAASDPIKNALADAMAAYTGISTTINGPWNASDHAPFEGQGFDACLLIEEWGNPYYHQQLDSVDTPNYMDYAFATDIVRGTIGYLATAAVVVIPEPGVIVLIVLGAAALLRRR